MLISGITGIDLTGLPINNSGNAEIEGNLNLSGVGARITGDFSNSTFSNRVMFQNSNANSMTMIGIVPSGTSTVAGTVSFGGSDVNNSPYYLAYHDGNKVFISADKNGTGAYTPLAFITGGSERVRIDTAGNVGVGTSSPIDKLGVKGNIAISSPVGTTYTDGSGVLFYRGADNTQMGYIGFSGTSTPIEFVNSKNTGFAFYNGDVLQKTPYGLGYGTGAGGTVTQLTSKSTSVTLNKPTGIIIMNGAALAAGTYVEFGVSNSVITNNDTVKLSLQDGFVGYRVEDRNVGLGGMAIRLTNITGGSLSQAVVINFVVIKGAQA